MGTRRVCVLTSGGIDSTVLTADLLRRGREVHPLFVRCGFRWEKAELFWLKRLLRSLAAPRLKALAVVDLPMAGLLDGHWSMTGRGVPSSRAAWDSVHLPGRNLLLLSYAALFCRVNRLDAVACALLEGNPFSDATPRFLKRMESTAAAALGRRVRIQAPYRRKTKRQVSALVPGLPLELTFSCLSPRGLRHCGRCSKCGERQAVLAGA